MTRRRLRDPNARLQMIGKVDPSEQLKEVRDVLVDMWSIVSQFSSAQAGAYTISGSVAHEVCIMTNTGAVVVTLPAFPTDLLKATIKRTDAQVTIAGNGKLIDGASTSVIGAQYDGASLIYTDALGGWSIIGGINA